MRTRGIVAGWRRLRTWRRGAVRRAWRRAETGNPAPAAHGEGPSGSRCAVLRVCRFPCCPPSKPRRLFLLAALYRGARRERARRLFLPEVLSQVVARGLASPADTPAFGRENEQGRRLRMPSALPWFLTGKVRSGGCCRPDARRGRAPSADGAPCSARRCPRPAFRACARPRNPRARRGSAGRRCSTRGSS